MTIVIADGRHVSTPPSGTQAQRRARWRAHHLPMLITVVALASGCSQTRTMTLPAAPADLYNIEMPVEVHAAPFVGTRHGRVAAGAAEGAMWGAGRGAGTALVGGAASGSVYGAAGGLVLAPVFAIGGAIHGAVAARPETETRAAVAAIEQVYQDTALLAGMGGTVKEGLIARGFPAEAPPCQPVRARVAGAHGAVPVACEPATQGNLLRLEMKYHFHTMGIFTPDLVVSVEVTGTASGAEQPPDTQFRWGYVAPVREFFAATNDNAALLRQEIRQAQQNLATRIVDDLAGSRTEVKVTGTYYPYRVNRAFLAPPIAPGAAQRLIPVAQLENVPASAFDK